MAIIGSKDSKKCTGDDIVLEASLSSTIHQKSASRYMIKNIVFRDSKGGFLQKVLLAGFGAKAPRSLPIVASN